MKTNSNDLERDRKITGGMILAQVVITGVIALVPWILQASIGLSLLIGIVVWSLILFKTPVFDMFFINVRPNFAVILGNQMLYDIIPGRPTTSNPAGPDPRTLMFDLKSLREVGSGMRGKFPWEVPFESVDLRVEIVIGTKEKGKPLICYTLDNIELTIEWQVTLTPLRGNCANLVRRGEAAMQAFFTGTFEQFTINWVKSKNESQIFSALTDLRSDFEKVFGGPDVVNSDEEDYGVYTNTPQIVSVNRSASYQKAAEAVQVGQRLGEVVREISTGLPNADPNMILAAATAIIGNDITGLLLIPGLSGDPKALTAILAAAANLGMKTPGGKNRP